MADSGAKWVQIMQQYNSGTYNNQVPHTATTTTTNHKLTLCDVVDDSGLQALPSGSAEVGSWHPLDRVPNTQLLRKVRLKLAGFPTHLKLN